MMMMMMMMMMVMIATVHVCCRLLQSGSPAADSVSFVASVDSTVSGIKKLLITLMEDCVIYM